MARTDRPDRHGFLLYGKTEDGLCGLAAIPMWRARPGGFSSPTGRQRRFSQLALARSYRHQVAFGLFGLFCTKQVPPRPPRLKTLTLGLVGPSERLARSAP
jgi:hypothetical protein